MNKFDENVDVVMTQIDCILSYYWYFNYDGNDVIGGQSIWGGKFRDEFNDIHRQVLLHYLDNILIYYSSYHNLSIFLFHHQAREKRNAFHGQQRF